MRNLSSKSGKPKIEEGIRLLPSEEIGEYEEPERPPEPFKRPPGGGLFPLDEEGKYGPCPIYGYTRRVRKPKVYASYAISSQSDQDESEIKNKSSSKAWKSSTSTSSSSFSSICPSPSPRSSSLSRPPSRLSNNSSRASKSPSPVSRISSESPSPVSRMSSKSPSPESRMSSQSPSPVSRMSTKSTSPVLRTSLRANRRVPSPSPDRQSQKPRCVEMNSNFSKSTKCSENVTDEKSAVRRIAREVKAQNTYNSNKIRSSSLKRVARNMRDSSFEENEEYDYKSNGETDKSGGRGASLSALREPAFPNSSLPKIIFSNPNTNNNANTKTTTNFNNNYNTTTTLNNNMTCSLISSKSSISKSIVRKTSYSSHAM